MHWKSAEGRRRVKPHRAPAFLLATAAIRPAQRLVRHGRFQMNSHTILSAALVVASLAAAAAGSFAQGPPPSGPGGPGGFRGGFGPGGLGGPGGPGGGMQGLLMMPEVQKELKLDDAQVELLQGLRPNRPQNFQDLQNLSQEERRKRFTAMRTEQDKKVAEILDAKQMTRLKQLELQQSGIRSLERNGVAGGG